MGDFLLESFPGLAIMANWHPLLVHFPIALLSCYFLVDLAGALARKAAWRDMAGGLLYLGTLFAAFAVALGLRAAEFVPHTEDVHAIMLDHRNHGFAVLGMALLLGLWRLLGGKRWSALGTVLHLSVAAVMVVIMAHGADLGGLMVYGHGVGVRAQEHGHSHDHVHDHADEADHHH